MLCVLATGVPNMSAVFAQTLVGARKQVPNFATPEDGVREVVATCVKRPVSGVSWQNAGSGPSARPTNGHDMGVVACSPSDLPIMGRNIQT